VTGGSVVVGAGVALGWAVVGVAVRGTGVADGEGDELGDADVEGDGVLADGAASC
jgi:hypothetical protein